jgi:hypothetical protein
MTGRARSLICLDDIVVGLRFLWNVPTLLRNPITREEARATLRRRFEQREDGFLRSYEKLTAGGMMFPDAEIIHVLEEVLPARFGGGATDYQLREEEGPDGSSCLRLLVHPALGSLDPDAVAHASLDAIGSGTGAARIMGLTWREAGLVRVERQAPGVTAAGKILHWHHARPSGVDTSPARR